MRNRSNSGIRLDYFQRLVNRTILKYQVSKQCHSLSVSATPPHPLYLLLPSLPSPTSRASPPWCTLFPFSFPPGPDCLVSRYIAIENRCRKYQNVFTWSSSLVGIAPGNSSFPLFTFCMLLDRIQHAAFIQHGCDFGHCWRVGWWHNLCNVWSCLSGKRQFH